MRGERAGSSTSIKRLQHGRFDLDEAVGVQVLAHSGDKPAANDENLPGLFSIGDQIMPAYLRMERAGAVLTGVMSALYELLGDSSHPGFKACLDLVKGLRV